MTVSLRKRGYPQLVRAHVRGAGIPAEVQAEVRGYFQRKPDIHACEAADHGFDPMSDIPRYLAQELAEPEHASLRNGPLTVEAIREWEQQEDAEHQADGHGGVVLKLHGPDEFFTDEVYAALKKNYPADTIQWAKRVDWRKSDVPLDNIQMARRPGGRDLDKVDGIAKAVADGRTMDRVVLVKTPGNDKYEIADGFHRTLAFERADQKTIPAYVAKVTSDHGPWEREMHDAKLNKSAFPVLVFRKDAPTTSDVHVDVPLGSQKKKRKKKDEPAEPEITLLKADDDQRIVYGIVLEPNVEDSQGDVVSKDDVEKAAHRFLYNGPKMGDQHRKLAPASVRPVESYIAPCDFEMGGQVVKAGTWVLATHIPDDDLWEQVKKGDKGAYSVAGTGLRSPL